MGQNADRVRREGEREGSGGRGYRGGWGGDGTGVSGRRTPPRVPRADRGAPSYGDSGGGDRARAVLRGADRYRHFRTSSRGRGPGWVVLLGPASTAASTAASAVTFIVIVNTMVVIVHTMIVIVNTMVVIVHIMIVIVNTNGTPRPPPLSPL